MFEAKLAEGLILKKIVESIKDIVTDVNIDVSPSGKPTALNRNQRRRSADRAKRVIEEKCMQNVFSDLILKWLLSLFSSTYLFHSSITNCIL